MNFYRLKKKKNYFCQLSSQSVFQQISFVNMFCFVNANRLCCFVVFIFFLFFLIFKTISKKLVKFTCFVIVTGLRQKFYFKFRIDKSTGLFIPNSIQLLLVNISFFQLLGQLNLHNECEVLF